MTYFPPSYSICKLLSCAVEEEPIGWPNQIPYRPKNRIVKLVQRITPGLADLEVDLLDSELTVGTNLLLEAMDLEAELIQPEEVIQGFDITTIDLVFESPEPKVQIDVKLRPPVIDLPLEIPDAEFKAAVELDAVVEDLHIAFDDYEVMYGTTLLDSQFEIELEVSVLETEPIVINTKLLPDSFDINYDILEPEAEVRFGFTLLAPPSLEVEILDPVVEWGTELDIGSESLTVDHGDPMQTEWGTNVILPDVLADLDIQVIGHHAGIVLPSSTKYVYSSGSLRDFVIHGVSSGKFKLAETGASYSRYGKLQVIHTDIVKPLIVTVQEAMKCVNLGIELGTGEWVFESQDQFLKIVNAEPITSVLVQDGDTTAIPITPGTNVNFIYSNITRRPVPK